MKMLALLVAAQAGSQPAGADNPVFTTTMVVKTDKLTHQELVTAQRYARCLSFPHFVLDEDFSAQQAKCRKARHSRNPNPALTGVLDQLDHVVSQNPGSEASLTVTRTDASTR